MQWQVYQRQMSKEGLQKVVDSEAAADDKAQVSPQLPKGAPAHRVGMLYAGALGASPFRLSCVE